VIDPYNEDSILLRATRPILPGEQIFVWYGPAYWCNDQHAIELLRMAVITYGINIRTSTWETNGDWKSLKKYEQLLTLLDAEGYKPSEDKANPFLQKSPPEILLHPITEAMGDVRNLETIIEGLNSRKRLRVQMPTRETTQSEAQIAVLVLGMVYTASSLLKSKLQLTRDGIRCRALERKEQVSVYTIDVGHDANKAEEGRHICHDFANVGLLEKMDRLWTGKSFKHIIMDYFYTPSAWHAERWSEKMYTITLPILAAKGAIPLHGEVWLPHIICIADRLERLWNDLKKWYTKHIIVNPMENPLFRASAEVHDELIADDNPFTNDTALKELRKDAPFIVLRCIRSGDDLDSIPTTGLASDCFWREMWREVERWTSGRRAH
jgi:hypothetical protein